MEWIPISNDTAPIPTATGFLRKHYKVIGAIAALCTILGFVSATLAHPNIDKFDITPENIFPNDGAKLSWSVLNAENVFIDKLGGNLPTQFSKFVYPKESTNYSLTATRFGGVLKCKATQEVHVWNPEVKITDPKNGTPVKASKTISGTFLGNLPEDHHIWIVVRSAKAEADKWWTQGDASIEGSPNWSVPGSFGSEQDAGENFTIKAILVDETVDYILLRNGRDGIYLPSSIKNLDVVSVSRVSGDLVLDITRPTTGDHVSSPVSIEGIASGTIPTYHDIWIIHNPVNSGLWYPDGSIDESIKSNAWKQQIVLVDPPGKEYNIKAVLVDNETSKEYQNSIKVGMETGKWPGFPESKEEGRVKVLDSILLILIKGT